MLAQSVFEKEEKGKSEKKTKQRRAPAKS